MQFVKKPIRTKGLLSAFSTSVVLCTLATSTYAQSSVTSSTANTVDPRMHPGEVRLLDLDPQKLKLIVPGVFQRYWFGTSMSMAMYRMDPKQGVSVPALHSHGTAVGFQFKGNATVLDEFGRGYALRPHDVALVRKNMLHTGYFAPTERVVFDIDTPQRPEYLAEELSVGYFPGHGKSPGGAPVPPLRGDMGAPIRVLFNWDTVVPELTEIIPGQLYFKHWHGGFGDDVSVSVTRMVRKNGKHFAGKVHSNVEEVVVPIKGRLKATVDGKPYNVAGQQALVIPPNKPQIVTCETDECLVVSWFTPRMDAWGPEGNANPELNFVDMRKK